MHTSVFMRLLTGTTSLGFNVLEFRCGFGLGLKYLITCLPPKFAGFYGLRSSYDKSRRGTFWLSFIVLWFGGETLSFSIGLLIYREFYWIYEAITLAVL